jgi:hypothetical protein
MLGIKIITGVLMVFGLFELFKLDDYVYLKKETINKIKFIIK